MIIGAIRGENNRQHNKKTKLCVLAPLWQGKTKKQNGKSKSQKTFRTTFP